MIFQTRSTRPELYRRAFTLVELLVAVAVLALLVVLTAQLTNNATNATLLSSKRLEVDNDVRTTFDRMSADFASMVRRDDVDAVFAKLPGNDAFYFYSQAPGFTRGPDAYPGRLSLVGYSIRRTTSPDSIGGVRPVYKLERGGILLAQGARGPDKGDGMMNYLTYPAVSGTGTPTALPGTTIRGGGGHIARLVSHGLSTPSDAVNSDWFHQLVIGDCIFRMEFSFLMKAQREDLLGKDGKPKYAPASQQGWYMSPNLARPNEMRAITTDVAAVIVTVAAIDSTSRVLVTKKAAAHTAGNLAKAADFFKDDEVADPPGVAKTWRESLETTLKNPDSVQGKLDMPAVSASQIRVYQRYFYVGGN